MLTLGPSTPARTVPTTNAQQGLAARRRTPRRAAGRRRVAAPRRAGAHLCSSEKESVRELKRPPSAAIGGTPPSRSPDAAGRTAASPEGAILPPVAGPMDASQGAGRWGAPAGRPHARGGGWRWGREVAVGAAAGAEPVPGVLPRRRGCAERHMYHPIAHIRARRGKEQRLLLERQHTRVAAGPARTRSIQDSDFTYYHTENGYQGPDEATRALRSEIRGVRVPRSVKTTLYYVSTSDLCNSEPSWRCAAPLEFGLRSLT